MSGSARAAAPLWSLLIATVLLASCSRALDPPAALEKAGNLIAAGQAGEARILLKNLLVEHPDAHAARFVLARIALDDGDARAANDELAAVPDTFAMDPAQRVIRLRTDLGLQRAAKVLETIEQSGANLPATPRVTLRAGALRQLGRAADSIQELRSALQAEPTNGQIAVELAAALAAVGYLPQAEAELTRFLDRQTGSTDALLARGELRLRRGAAAAGLADLRAAVERAPTDWPASSRLGAQILIGDALMSLGRVEESRTHIEALEKRYPGSVGARLLRANLALLQNRPAEAVDLLQQIAEVIPDNARIQVLLVDALIRSGNLARATEVLERRVQTAPEDLASRRALARLMLEQRRPDRVIELLSAAESGAVDRAASADDDLLSVARRVRDQASGAIGALEARLAQEPRNASLRAQLAAAYLDNGDAARALAMLRDNREARVLPLGAATEAGALRALGNIRELNLFVDEATRGPAYPGEALLAAADALQQGDRADAAERLIEAVLAREPANAQALLRLANLRFVARDYDGAEKALLRLDEQAKREVGYGIARARLAEARDRPDEARRLLAATAAAAPGSAEASLALAAFELRANDLAAANRALDAMIAAGPRDGRFAAYAGGLLMQARQADAARARFATAIEQAPDVAGHWFNLGRTQLMLDDREAAAASFAKAVELKPESVEAAGLAAQLALARRDVGAARRLVAATVERSPQNPLAWALVGEVAAAEGRFAQASEAFARSYSLRPTPVAAVGDHRARVLGKLERPDLPLVNWLAREPGDLAVRRQLSDYYLASGQDEQAVTQLETILGRAPNDVLALNNLAWLLATRRPERAEQLARRAHAIAPENGAVADTLGWVLINRNKAAEARSVLESAVAALPEDRSVRYHYALALMRAGAREQARDEIARSLAGGAAFAQRAAAEKLQQELSP